MTATPVVDSLDRPAWLKARTQGVTATDVAKLMTASGRRQVVAEKLWAAEQDDSPLMAHGRDREPVIAAMVKDQFGIEHNTWLYAGDDPRHLATPDGIGDGVLAEIKTSQKPLLMTPRNYRDQIYWQLHVFGFDTSLLVWEQHFGGVPVDLEPTYRWVELDRPRLELLIIEANSLLAYLDTERQTNGN